MRAERQILLFFTHNSEPRCVGAIQGCLYAKGYRPPVGGGTIFIANKKYARRTKVVTFVGAVQARKVVWLGRQSAQGIVAEARR